MKKLNRIPLPGDYIRTTSERFGSKVWRGRIRRQDSITEMYLIEWAYCGGLPTDICTWVFSDDMAIVRRPKARETRYCDECERFEEL